MREKVQTNFLGVSILDERLRALGSCSGPNFIALLNGKHIFVLTVAEKIAKVQAYFTG